MYLYIISLITVEQKSMVLNEKWRFVQVWFLKKKRPNNLGRYLLMCKLRLKFPPAIIIVNGS